ncbi:MAG: gamma-glutamyl-gamma-aminobutyrate hydrolase family protein [Actinomycetota bacterium]
MSRPLIAVPAYPIKTGRVEGWVSSAVAAPDTYLYALRRAGAQEAVLMPDELDEHEANDLLDRFDGLLLLGGGDLDPETYGQARAEETYGVIGRRDGFELPLVRAAVGRGLPTLAICRGHQALNVALGGTLEQHIPTGDVSHGLPGVEGGAAMHAVRLQEGSRLAQAMGTTRARVSSHHHQAVEKLGDGLEAVAWADDGVVEGIELANGDAWIVGAQWHPEDTATGDPAQQRLFDAFATQAKK